MNSRWSPRCTGTPLIAIFRPSDTPPISRRPVHTAVMVAVIFRALDALRIFDLIYVLTPNDVQTKSMSIFTRENLFEFDKFAYGAAASTMLFLIIATITVRFREFG